MHEKWDSAVDEGVVHAPRTDIEQKGSSTGRFYSLQSNNIVRCRYV